MALRLNLFGTNYYYPPGGSMGYIEPHLKGFRQPCDFFSSDSLRTTAEKTKRNELARFLWKLKVRW